MIINSGMEVGMQEQMDLLRSSRTGCAQLPQSEPQRSSAISAAARAAPSVSTGR